ncbi:hypothetical protein J4H86_05075 [Spiractinospora alimapuensis]|uniref:DUF6879 family protein n=1 Tax=Spiractinospora alimapuensis TaxID=2820884 RepID=UPI001F296212|nr:DUF6879 family protein [Spiractinospora alimapuensis]QVQ53162.1 hypothetical protein J4H86_05075 [Spiractinospora alimapuensis]
MLEQIPDVPGVHLDLDAYLRDFRQEFEHGGDIFAKLERAQTFREPGDPSWEAFAAGDWQRALELNEEDRPSAVGMIDTYRRLGYATQRIRVVEFPISPYLQWEIQFLRLLAEAGQDIRVLRGERAAEFEAHRPLPELVIIGDRVLYEVLYDDSGTPAGGRRIDDRKVIAGCRRDVAKLYAQGEPLLAFYDQHIAPLPPPIV